MRNRPALVVSTRTLGGEADLLWVLMITSAANAPWPHDIPVADHALYGLPMPCVVRTAKISTIEAASAKSLGRLPDDTMLLVQAVLAQTLALSIA